MNSLFEIIVEAGGVKQYLTGLTSGLLAFDFSINQIQDISSLSSGHSYNIRIPANPNNAQVFGFLNVISVSSVVNQDKKIKCQVLQDSLVVVDGFIQIKSVSYDHKQRQYYFNTTIFSDNFNLYSNMGDKMMSDLNISELNHIWSHDNIVNSWTQSWEHGYYYPLIDQGQNWNNWTINDTFVSGPKTEDMYPSIYAQYLFRKLINDNGYNINSNWLLNGDLRNAHIPFCAEQMSKPQSFINSHIFRVGLTNSVSYTTPVGSLGVEVPFPFDNENPPNGDYNGFWDTSTYTYTHNNSGTYSQRFNMRFSLLTDYVPPFINTGNLSIIIRFVRSFDVNGNTASTWGFGNGDAMPTYGGQTLFGMYTTASMPIIVATAGSGISILGQFSTDFLDGSDDLHRPLMNGEQVRVKLTAIVPFGNSITVGQDTFICNELDQAVIPGEMIDMNRNLPLNWKQKDFFATIVKMFNLYVETDKDNPDTLIIEPRDDYYASGKVENWTRKVDLNTMIESNISPEDNKTYLFKYKDDKDAYNELYKGSFNETYGQMRWEIDSDFKNKTKTLQFDFSPTPVSAVQGMARMIIPKIYKEDNGIVKRTTSNPRILLKSESGLVSLISGSYSESWTLNGIEYFSYPYSGHYDQPFDPTFDINPGQSRSLFYADPEVNLGTTSSNIVSSSLVTNNNLVNKYWARQLSEVSDRDSRIISCEAYLTPQDINEFRFNKNIFIDIDESGQYYKVNKISSYNPSMLTTCKLELIKTKDLQINDIQTIINTNININPGSMTIHNLGNLVQGPNIISNGIGNHIGGYSNIVNGNYTVISGPLNFTNGQNNNIGQGSSGMFISGDDNTVEPIARRSNIIGSRSRIAEGVEDSTVIGSDMVVDQSNTTYIANNFVTSFNLVDGGEDIVLDPFQSNSICNLLDGGEDVVFDLGTYNPINLIDGNK